MGIFNLAERRELRKAQHALALANIKRATAAAEAESAAIAAQSSVVAEAANIFNQDDAGAIFDRYNYPTGDALDEGDHLDMQRRIEQAVATDSFAHGWVEIFVRFVVGRHCKLTAVEKDDDTQEYLDKWCAGILRPDGRREKPWSNRAEEWVRRTFRAGENFTRNFVNEANGDYYLRFLNPQWIRNPVSAGGDYSFGIRCKSNDIESPVEYAYWVNGYSYQYGASRNGMWQPIPAEDVIHTKIGDSDMKRGRPLLLPVIADLVELNKLLRARRKLNWLRSLYAVEKTIKGSWPDLNKALHNKNKTTSGADSTGTKEAAPREASVIAHNEQIAYEFKTPNLQASDADSDIRRHGNKIMVGLGLSELVGMGDASNNNYSGGELAESPMVTTMRYWQGFFEPDFKEVGRRVIQAGMDSGALPEKTADGKKRSTEVHVTFPTLVVRDIEKEARAQVLMIESGLSSRRTAQIKLDLSPETEDEQIELERGNGDSMNLLLNGTQNAMRAHVNNGSSGNNGNGEASSARRTNQLRSIARSRV